MTGQVCDRFLGNRRERGVCAGIDTLLQRHDEAIIEPPVDKPGPGPGRVPSQLQFIFHLSIVLGEDNMHRDHIRIQAVDSGRVH